jgi:hypothetical protein
MMTEKPKATVTVTSAVHYDAPLKFTVDRNTSLCIAKAWDVCLPSKFVKFWCNITF